MDNISFAQRMVGAIILLSLAIIFVPMLLENEDEIGGEISGTNIPSMPDNLSTIVFQLDNEGLYRELDKQVEAGEVVSIAEAQKITADQSQAPAEQGAGSSEQTSALISTEKTNDPDLTTWMIQLGSFSDEANAIALRDRLRAKKFTAFVRKNVSQSGTIWQVRVGPELDPKRAQQTKKMLEAETGLKALVLRHQG